MRFGLLAAFAMAAIALGPGAQAATVITFKTCNKTNYTVFIGATFMAVGAPTGVWRNEGWKLLGPNACRDIFKTGNKTFYARAEVKGDPDQYWGKDIKQCVTYPGPYDYTNKSEDTTCPKGEPALMTTFHSDGSPTFTWTLNP